MWITGSWSLLEVAKELVNVFMTSILGPGCIVIETLAIPNKPSREKGARGEGEEEEEAEEEEEKEEKEGEERKLWFQLQNSKALLSRR